VVSGRGLRRATGLNYRLHGNVRWAFNFLVTTPLCIREGGMSWFGAPAAYRMFALSDAGRFCEMVVRVVVIEVLPTTSGNMHLFYTRIFLGKALFYYYIMHG
jgi:hypothetical protein